MKYILFAFLLPLLAESNCNKDKDKIPSCIQQKIEEIKAQSKWNPPGQVDEYNYRGQRMFLITSNCCDQFISLYDENCNLVCAPSGGIAGSGDGKCKDFYQVAKHVKLIWKDER